MAKRLKYSVYVDGRRYDPGRPIPAKIAEQITNPKVWADDPRHTAADDDADGDNVDNTGEGGEGTGVPPAGAQQPAQDVNRPAPDADRKVWAEYAAGLTPPVAINGRMNRDQIINAVDAAQAGQGS